MPGLAEPPRRIVTDRLLMRPFRGRDAPLLKDAVDSSLEHLRTFMEWAWAAPEPVSVIRSRLRSFRRSFDRGEHWMYGIFTLDESEILGGAGLHRRIGPEALEIGYWIRASRVRQGLASEAAAALTRVAFERCGVVRVEIHIDPANEPSVGVAERLGFVHDAVLRKRLPPMRPGAPRRDEVVFSLLDVEYPASPVAAFRVQELRPRP